MGMVTNLKCARDQVIIGLVEVFMTQIQQFAESTFLYFSQRNVVGMSCYVCV